jgi:2-succinyl-6-hydroxy-2,4-cyclohexadiene-1-carboxylate synthase
VTPLLVNGVHLNVEVSGEGPALLLLHGFTGDVSTWEPFFDRWASFKLIRVDVIGHGRSDSPSEPARYSMAHAVEDLLAILDQLGVRQTALLGYSMGGRLALHIALAAPERLWALVLESASPGIADPKERKARVASDNVLADSIERDGLEAFVDRWQSQPLFSSQASLPPEVFEHQRRQRLASNPIGLANSLRGMGAGRQDYLISRLPELSLPTLLIAGALDERYTALTNDMSQAIPHSAVAIIQDAGHAAHLEQPDGFAELAGDFLSRTTPSSAHPEPVEGR